SIDRDVARRIELSGRVTARAISPNDRTRRRKLVDSALPGIADVDIPGCIGCNAFRTAVLARYAFEIVPRRDRRPGAIDNDDTHDGAVVVGDVGPSARAER